MNTDPRISRRRRAVERDRRARAAWWAGGVAAVVAVVAAALWSPLLSVRDVEVVGEDNVTAAEVAAATGLGPDDNLLVVSTGEIARRVESLAWVRDAKAERRLPGTVRVRIDERRPALVLDDDAGRWLLAGSGHVLDAAPVKARLPVIAGVHVGELEPGERVSADGAAAALKVWRSLPAKLQAEVAALLAPTGERITLTLGDGMSVRYGGPRSLQAKNEVLSILLAEMRREGRTASYIDVRVPTTPAIGPPPAAPAAAVGSHAPTPAASPTPSPTASP